MIAVSSDGGQTWTTRTQTQPGTGLNVSVIEDPNNTGSSPPGHGFMFYPHVTVGPEGDVYVGAFAGGDFTVYYSDDGGASFRPPDYADQLGIPFSVALPTSTLFADAFRTDPVRDIVADPSQPGRVYVTEANEVNDSAVGGTIDPGEILFASSADYGQTWEPQFQVGDETTNLASLPPGENDAFLSVLNDDDGGNDLQYATAAELNNETINAQGLPAMTVDAQGNVTVIWYDTRRDPSQSNLDVFGTVSTDGGENFSPNFRVSDTSFNPYNGAFTDATGQTNFYIGDQIGVAAANGVAYAVWTDTRNGGQQIEFSRYSLTQVPAPPLDRLYPNNTPASATSLGEVIAQQVLPKLTVGPGDDNWFNLQAGATGNLVVTATATAGGAVPQLQLTDSEGNPLTATVTDLYDASGAVDGTELVYQSTSGETYLVHVSGRRPRSWAIRSTAESYTADLGTSIVRARPAARWPRGEQYVYRLVAGRERVGHADAHAGGRRRGRPRLPTSSAGRRPAGRVRGRRPASLAGGAPVDQPAGDAGDVAARGGLRGGPERARELLPRLHQPRPVRDARGLDPLPADPRSARLGRGGETRRSGLEPRYHRLQHRYFRPGERAGGQRRRHLPGAPAVRRGSGPERRPHRRQPAGRGV